MTRLGQHFLINQSALKKIAESLGVKKNDVVIEIGAGHGELTNELRITNNELRIIAIEKDRELINLLREKFSQDKNTEIIEGDVLTILPDIIHDSSFKIHTYKLVGNIPYYITGKLLRLISEFEHKPILCVFTIQKEVAERLAKQPPGMNRLAASVQFWAISEIIQNISRKDFEPVPEVDSAIILLRPAPKRNIESKIYYQTVRTLFQQPRKTILNNLASGTKIKKEILIQKLSEIGIDPTNRPQNLSIEDIITIASIIE